MRLLIAAWNTMGWSNERDAYVRSQLKTKDVIALTECGNKIQAFAGRGLIVADRPPDGDPAGAAAIALSSRAQDLVIGSGSKGSRLVWVRLQGLFKNILIIAAYIPHSGRKRAPFQEDTLQELEDLIQEVSTKGECVIVMGDMNAKLKRGVEGLTGKYCIHPRADGGERD